VGNFRGVFKVKLNRRWLMGRFKNAPLMTILFATSTSMLMYQNCSPAAQSTSSASSKNAVYSSTVGGTNGALGPGSGASGGSMIPGGAVTVPGGGGTSGGGTGGGGTAGGGTAGGGTAGGGTAGGTIPVDTGGNGGTSGAGQPGTGGSGGTGYTPGGTTGGIQEGLIWQYQPEDRTVEEGDVLTLSSYATKGIDIVSYQWYKNGVALTGQTGYMYRAFLLPLSAAGTYYVVAKSGTSSIQSVSITVKVKAARNPCAAGAYGFYPGTQNYNELYHESLIGRTNTYTSIQSELADGYTAKLAYANPYYAGPYGDCIAAVGIFQCRNGKMVSTDQLTCTQYRESGGGI
jgi:hypothetical protein